MDPFAGTNTQYTTNVQPTPQDDMVWWLKWLIKGASVFLGFMAVVLGIVTTISISLKCMIAGIILIFGGVLVLALEVPICCSFIEFIRPLTKFSEGRPHWQKCGIYMVCPIIVIILCPGAASIIGSLCIFGVAGLYFMLTVGKKAPVEIMRTRATTGDSKANLTTDQQIGRASCRERV